ncbi:MAG: metal-dependent hydrolase [Actinomycetota bacterium]
MAEPMTSAADASPQRRKVKLDFTDSEARWNPRHEQFAYLVNAISTLLPYLERFLVDCVDGAIDQIPESKAELRQEMADFCYQERRHNANHVLFNRMIARHGYAEELAEGEAKLERYYADLRSKDDRFGLAWCEGFETVAPFVGVFMFEHGEEFGLSDWSDPTNALWLWHMSEEFEHRTVCNDAYGELHDHYPTRIRGLWSSTLHLFAYSVPLAWKMAGRDWASLSRRQRWRNRARFGSMLVRLSAYIAPRLIGRAMRPSYDPASMSPPEGMQDLLDALAAEHGVAASA